MRGLDKNEVEQLRRFIVGNTEHMGSNHPDYEHRYAATHALKARGLVVPTSNEWTGEYWLQSWQATDAGRLALRIADSIAEGRKILMGVGGGV